MKTITRLFCQTLLVPGILLAQWEQKESSIMRRIPVDDFLVNDDTTGGAWQGAASIAVDGNGNFVTVWEDERNGNLDIYFQRYDASGVRQENNQKPMMMQELRGNGFPQSRATARAIL